MPSASRRKAKKAKKVKTLTTPNHHSSSAVQPQQGEAVFANHSKEMDESLNGTLQDTHRVESLSEDKEVVVEVDAADYDGDKSLSENPDDDDVTIIDEDATQKEENEVQNESGKVEETEAVSESVEPDAIKDLQVDNVMVSDTVELEFKEEKEEEEQEQEQEEKEKEKEKEFFSDQAVKGSSSDQAVAEDVVKKTDNEPSSVSGNEGLTETEVVETVMKDMKVAEEEENGLSSAVKDDTSSMPLTDVASKGNVDTSIPKSDDESEMVPPTIIKKSLEPTMDEKIGEPSDVQGEPAYQSATDNSSFQSSPNVHVAESTGVTVQDNSEMVPRSPENPTIVPVTPRQHSSWKSCCGLFEIMRVGDR